MSVNAIIGAVIAIGLMALLVFLIAVRRRPPPDERWWRWNKERWSSEEKIRNRIRSTMGDDTLL
ncbi:MAG TPA: hypothetical protein VG167_14920 [Verrucomicrobiae bacterium]|nr:hypothetical protein [Verrucomicrobiae bacterium]